MQRSLGVGLNVLVSVEASVSTEPASSSATQGEAPRNYEGSLSSHRISKDFSISIRISLGFPRTPEFSREILVES